MLWEVCVKVFVTLVDYGLPYRKLHLRATMLAVPKISEAFIAMFHGKLY